MKALFLTVLVLLLSSIDLISQTNADLTIPSDSTAQYGDTVSIPVIMNTDSLVNQAYFCIEYDSSIISLETTNIGNSVNNFSIFKTDSILDYDTYSEGTNKHVFIQIDDEYNEFISGDNIELAQLNFRVVSHLGASPLNFKDGQNITFLETINQDTLTTNLTNGFFAVTPETTAVLSLETDTLNILHGTLFSVGVEINNIWDLHEFELELSFDPQIIRVVSVIEGNFLNNNGQDDTSWEPPVFNNLTGIISNIKCTRLSNTGKDGSGSLAIINFQTHEPGTSHINFNTNNCNFSDPKDNNIIISEILSTNVNIYHDPVAELSIPDTSGAPNRIMDIPVYISGIEYSAIISLLMSVSTDTNYLIPISVSTENSKTESWQTPVVNINNGTMIFAMAGYSQLSENGKLLTLRYLVNDNANEDETCTIKIDNVLLNEGDPTTIVNDGNFLVKGLQIAGKLNYYGTENPIPNAEFQITGKSNASTNSDSEGNFSFTELHYGDYVLNIEKEGHDITCITPFDAALILQHSVQLTQLSYHQMIAADVTADKTVSPLDAANILQYSVALIDKFPIMTNANDYWQFTPSNFTLNDTNWYNAPDSVEYKPLEHAQFNQNFVGIIYGDVSQSWEYNNNIFTKQNNSANIKLGAIIKTKNDLILVPVIVNSVNSMFSLFLEILNETNKLNLVSVEKTDIISDYQIAHNVVNENIKISLASAEPKTLNDTILNLYFKQLESETGKIEIKNAVINENQQLIITNVSTENKTTTPQKYVLSQNYPNPFNNSTNISFSIPVNGNVMINIFNLHGRIVKTLIDDYKIAGSYLIQWNGYDNKNKTVSTGEYFVVLKINDQKLIRKIIFMK